MYRNINIQRLKYEEMKNLNRLITSKSYATPKVNLEDILLNEIR